MNATAALLLWITIASTLICLVHRYMWMRWVRDMHWPAPLHKAAQVLLILMSVAVPAMMAVSRWLPTAIETRLMLPFYTWLGFLFYFLLGMGTLDLIRWATVTFRKWRGIPEAMHQADRRRFIGRALGGSVGLMGCSVSGAAYIEAAEGPIIERVKVPLPSFPRALSGLKIVQISDLHVGPTVDKAFVENVVRLALSCQPDLIAITGDMVDGSVDALRDAVAPLAQLKARLGTYYVTGNHEYYSGVGPWLTHFRELGMHVLANEHALIEDGDAKFYVAGIHDYSAARFGHSSDIEQALRGTQPHIPTILLAHQPRSILAAARPQICLQLSGHTHAGQMWPFGYLVKLVQPYLEGLHKHGSSSIYVNRGTAYWGPPMRWPQRSEITELTLYGDV